MPSEITQTQTTENEPSTRTWGQEFILYDPDNPSGSWLSISEGDLVDLANHQ